MKARNAIALLAASAALAAGCGSDDGDDGSSPAASKPKPVSAAERQAQLDRDPHSVRCSDIRNEELIGSTRRLQYALADDAAIRGLNRLQASQSIYYALTEVCKGRPASHLPAEEAVAGVRSGKYRAEL